jgi:hypothetical protein
MGMQPYLNVFWRQKLQLGKDCIHVPGVLDGLQPKVHRVSVWFHVGIGVLPDERLLQARHVFRAYLRHCSSLQLNYG